MASKQIIFLLVACLLSVAFAAPSIFFSPKDANAFASLVKAQQSKSGAFNDKIQDTYLAVDLLQALGVAVPSTQDVCKFASQALDGDVASIHSAVEVLESLKCLKSAVSDAVAKKLTQALESDNFLDLYHSISAIHTLSKNKHISVEQKKLLSAFESITDLLDSDGSFKLNDESEGSAYYAGLAYKVISQLWPSLETDEEKEKVNAIVTSLETLLDNGDEIGSTLSFSHTDSSVSTVTTTSVLIDGIVSLKKAMGKHFSGSIDDAQLAQIAEFIVNQKQTTSIETAHAVLTGLHALNSGVFKKPLVLSLVQHSLQSSAKKDDANIKAKVTDLFGKPAPTSQVYLARAYSTATPSTPLISNQELSFDASNNVYTFNFIGAKPEPGLYQIEFRVTPKSEGDKWLAIDSAKRSIRVVTSVELTNVEIIVSGSRDLDLDSQERHKLEVGKKLKNDLTVDTSKHLFITFRLKNKVSGKSLTVQQAFVTFTDVKTKEDIFFVTPYDTSKRTYKLYVDPSKFKNRSGQYTIKILIGDSYIDNSFEWEAATVNFKFEGKPIEEQSTAFVPKPEINHVFRTPEPRAPKTISQTFTILTLAPFAILIVGLFVVGLNFGLFPGGISALNALAFHLTLAALFGVMGLYWLELTIIDALKYMGVISLPLIFFGHRTLRAVALKRLGKN